MNKNIEELSLDKMKQEIYSGFKKIKNGNICLKYYSYETATYSYYDVDLDYKYWLTSELNETLNKILII